MNSLLSVKTAGVDIGMLKACFMRGWVCDVAHALLRVQAAAMHAREHIAMLKAMPRLHFSLYGKVYEVIVRWHV